MIHTEPILLIGLRGSGKTTLGPLLADQSGRTFIDLDDAVARHLKSNSAADAINTLGLDQFRRAEAQSLAKLLTRPRTILALGGGTPTAPGARELLERCAHANGRIIYLRAQPGTLRARLEQSDTNARPSLTGLGTLEEIENIYTQRDPLYQSLATRTINIDSLTINQTVDAIRAITNE